MKEDMMESTLFSMQNDPRTPRPLPQLGLRGCADSKAPLSSDSLSDSFHNLIGRYRVRGKYADMEPLCQLALEIQEHTLGPEHFEVALTLNDLAEAYHLQGKYAKAELLYQRALVILKNTLGHEHPRVSTTLGNLAKLNADQGHYAQAEQFYLCSLAIQKKTRGPDHPDVALHLKHMAELYYKWSLATL
jgi:tetratricopeptide (TPR) repeat protein